MTDPDTSSIAERTADLKAREQSAGGPEQLVVSLAGGLRRLRTWVLLSTVGLVLDVALSMVVGAAVLSLQHSQRTLGHALAVQRAVQAQTATNAAVAHADCLSGNTFRANDKNLWGFFLSLPAGPGVPPAALEQRAANIAAMKAHLDKTFAAQVCR